MNTTTDTDRYIICRKCGHMVKNLRGLSAHDRKHRREEAGYTESERRTAELDRN